jgi:sugar fermentation stimulation protein A
VLELVRLDPQQHFTQPPPRFTEASLVKTLEENGVVLFPDAPTLRGVKHLNELSQCVKSEYEAQVIFVIQMKDVQYFTPNNRTHPEFGATLIAAQESGVKVVALDCAITEDSLAIGNSVPIRLKL